MNQENNYVVMIKEVKTAVKFAGDVENKWQNAGKEVLAYFGDVKALDECKAQFQADAILPAIDAKHARALAVDLPRKGSKEFVEMLAKDASYQAKWDLANQAKKDARSTVSTMYARIKKYAFETESTTSTKKTFVEKLSKLVEDCANLKDAPFDIVACMKFLVEAEKVAKNTK